MRSILKGKEPPELAEARRTAQLRGGSITAQDWPPAGPRTMGAIRTSLYVEQAGLCAYCATRIPADRHPDPSKTWTVKAADRGRPARGGMSAEHWLPRSGFPDSDDPERAQCGGQTLDWQNLLGVCVGVSLLPARRKELHCDQSRGNRRLSIHPAATPNLSRRFKVNAVSGELAPASVKDRALEDDIAILNLNAQRLKANRAQAIDTIRRKLRHDDSRHNLLRLWRLATISRGDRLPPFAPAVERYLERKLKARGLWPASL